MPCIIILVRAVGQGKYECPCRTNKVECLKNKYKIVNLKEIISSLGLRVSIPFRETDKLLFLVFTQLFFWNTQLFFKEEVSISKIVNVTKKILENNSVTPYTF